MLTGSKTIVDGWDFLHSTFLRKIYRDTMHECVKQYFCDRLDLHNCDIITRSCKQ